MESGLDILLLFTSWFRSWFALERILTIHGYLHDENNKTKEIRWWMIILNFKCDTLCWVRAKYLPFFTSWFAGWFFFERILTKYRYLHEENNKKGKQDDIWNAFFIISFPMTYHHHYEDNGVLWVFFQMQNNWRAKKWGEGRYGALNPLSVSRLKFKMFFIINLKCFFSSYFTLPSLFYCLVFEFQG